MPFPAGWWVPNWPAPAHVRAVCTTRTGGVSQGAYESLNLGDHVGDATNAVARNRARFAKEIGARPVFLQQVHGRHATALDANTPDGTEADGCFTRDRSVACTIMVADCLPVLFTSTDGRAVAAAHAGWRGLVGEGGQGVIESVWQLFRSAANGAAIDQSATLAWLGPCIGPEAFEVGGEVKAAFEARDAGAAAMFRPHTANKWLADLQGLARRRLQALGITRIYGNDGSRDWCTVSNPSRFFSHRRDRVSGRFAASIWLA
jgi:polyphenol oxidase